MRLSPQDPEVGWWHDVLAGAELGLHQYQAAIDDAKRAIDGGFRWVWAYANLASAHALSGQFDEAKSAVAEALRLNADLTVKWFTSRGKTEPVFLEGLRKARLPEGDGKTE
jgi:tetratricopeptide (TPR) repeat protein